MKRVALLTLPALALLAACGSKDAPTGQVVATVDGTEITQSELNAELNGARANTAAGQRELQQAALAAIVNRVLLAKAADDLKIDETPAGAIAKQRAEQLAQIEMLEGHIRGSVPRVSAEEANQFIADNPDLFNNRQIFLVEQITVANPPPSLLAALRPINSMTDVQAYLASQHLPAQTSFGVLDAIQLDPQIVHQIRALAPGEVFVMPDQSTIRINRIKETQTVPITGAAATGIATELLTNQRGQQQLNDQVSRILTAGRARVSYNPAFRPAPAPTAAPAGAAPAAEDQ